MSPPRPHRPMRWVGAAVLASLALLVGCSGDEGADGPPASVRTDSVGPVPGATVGTTPLTTPEDEAVPELAVPIVSAEVAVDVLLAAAEDAFDPEEPDWGVPAAWREVAPEALFAGPATHADPETISGVEVVVSGDGEDVLVVAVEDEDGRCATLVLRSSETELTSEYGPEPEDCSGQAALIAWEELQDAEAAEADAAPR